MISGNDQLVLWFVMRNCISSYSEKEAYGAFCGSSTMTIVIVSVIRVVSTPIVLASKDSKTKVCSSPA